MNDKLKRFMSDKGMNEAVKAVLTKSFMKSRSKDVQVLAAERLALDFLEDAWRDLERYLQEEVKDKVSVQVGL